MRPLLILKLGSTYPWLAARYGDFEDWVRDGMELSQDQVVVLDAREHPLPADPTQFAGIVLTGSHAMVTDRESWSERTADWIPRVAASGTPLLGICYGHQLIAHALGGEVGFNPRGEESGIAEIRLSQEGLRDRLLGRCPSILRAQVSHAQSVVRLPRQAVCLAWNSHDPHHAFRVGDAVWGVQFHPEFSPAVSQAYLDEAARELGRGDYDFQVRSLALEETPESRSLLRQFGEIARSS